MPTPNSTLLLKGSLTIAPAPSSLCNSGTATVSSDFCEAIAVDAQIDTVLTLTVDTPVVIDLTTLTNVNALEIKSESKIKIVVTTVDGAAQVLPVDTFLAWMSASVPITALSLVRVAGITTNVRVIVARKAT